MWAPGTFAAANPVINVKFGVTELGMAIEGADGATEIATGSGRAFPIRFKDPSDRKAKADGFAVLVNGELKSGDRLIQSFRSEAAVPRNLGPMDCSLVFTANKRYELMISSEKERVLNRRVSELFIGGRGPTDQHQQGTVHYKGSLTVFDIDGRPLGSHDVVDVTVTGSNVTIMQINRPNSLPMTGECTGQEVRVRMPPSPFGAGSPKDLQWRIRPLH